MNKSSPAIALFSLHLAAACAAEPDHDGPPYMIRGDVMTHVQPSAGNDGIGTLRLSATGSCQGEGELATGSIPGVDLSEPGAVADFELEVPETGHWSLAMFLDDDESGQGDFPAPSQGDMTNFDFEHTRFICSELEVDGDVEGVEYHLVQTL